MAHTRVTAEPSFGEWITQTLLLPTMAAGGWPAGIPLLRRSPTIIPNYQRGISWTDAEVNELIYSTSPVIGTVVAGKFTGAVPSPYIDATSIGGVAEYDELADGLQRFSTGVALMRGLNRLVLANGSRYNHVAANFSQIGSWYSGHQLVIEHNDQQLRQHPRRAIRDQYSTYADSVEKWLEAQLDPAKLPRFAPLLEQLLIVRPIALDRWIGFASGLELMHTFLGLNTIRVELGPVDLLRAYLVLQATQCGWSDADIEAFENDFTDVFTTSSGKEDSALLPFVNAVLKFVTGANAAPAVVFPSWTALDKTNDVDPFLDFVQRMRTAATTNNYLNEIRLVGAIPLGIVIAAHLRRYRATGVLPSFVSGAPTAAEEAELHALLCASLRSSFAKKLGYLSGKIVDCLGGSTASLLDAAEEVSQDAVHQPITAHLPAGWIETQLEAVDKRAARTVFNAMLLPVRTPNQPHAGGPYAPVNFSRGATNWAVDHLLPEANLNDNLPGYGEGRRLRNLAPLPSAQNSSAKHVAPSVKLGGSVASYYGHAQAARHPYCGWLASQAQGLQAAQVDDQRELRANAVSRLGDHRIAHIASELSTRL